MLMIRLARRGKKNHPFYRIVVSEKGRDMFGDALEIVGNYDPVSREKTTTFNAERILYWIGKGAHASPTVYNLLVAHKIMAGAKIIKKKTKAQKEDTKAGAGERTAIAA